MGVASAFARAATRPVLHHRIDALEPPAVGQLLIASRGLETIHVGTSHISGQARILAKRATHAAPTGICRHIDLRRERRGDAQRTILDGGYLAKTAHHLGAERSRQAQAARPKGDLSATAIVILRVGLCAMSGIGTVVGRNAMADAFHQRLHIVVPTCRHLGALHFRDQDMAHIILDQELALRIRQVGSLASALGKRLTIIQRRAKPLRSTRNRLMRAIKHQAGDLLDRELRSQVGRTLLGLQAPILILVELAIAIQVFEGKAINGQQLHSRPRGIAQGGSSILSDCTDGIILHLAPFLSATSRSGQQQRASQQHRGRAQRF